MQRPASQHGFTLTELAVVLVIIALLLGGLLVPLSTQQDLENHRATTSQLTNIREALLGFVATYGRLPCPDTDNSPVLAGYGVEEPNCSVDAAAEGFLPWKTLGVPQHDAWGGTWQAAVEPRRGHWRYRIERDYADAARLRTLILNNDANNSTACAGGIPPAFPDDCLSILNSAGLLLFAQNERPIALAYSVGPNNQADGQNASYEANRAATPTYQADVLSNGFDDQLIWLTRSNLINLLITTGKLP